MDSDQEIKELLSIPLNFTINFINYYNYFPCQHVFVLFEKLIHWLSVTNDDASRSDDENSPIEQVALTVPVIDDPSLRVFTFRTWTLGTLACVFLSFLNQFFGFRREPLSVTAISAQIAVVPLGHLMAATLTDRVFMKGKKWEFTLNPGKFNVKEHVLITIFASSGAASVYAIHFVSAIKVFYRKEITVFVALLVVLTTQVLGFGWAGVFRRYLVEPAAMWWPQNLVQVSLFRYLIFFSFLFCFKQNKLSYGYAMFIQ